MRLMYDAVSLIASPPGVDATAFYIGGKDPYRVWPSNEIDGIHTRYRLPIWVNSIPSGAAEGTSEGISAATWAIGAKQPRNTCIALDFETAVNSAYVQAFNDALGAHGYKTLLYGSKSTVLSNWKPSGGYWVAQWDGDPSLPPGWAAKQFNGYDSYDLSIVADSTPLWDTQVEFTEDIMSTGLLNNGVEAVTVIPVPKGKYSTLVLLTDNGFQGLGPVSLRIATCEGSSWSVVNMTLDSKNGSYSLAIGANVEGFSIARRDSGNAVVGYSVS